MYTMVSSCLARSVKHIEKIWNPVFSSGLTLKHPQPSGKLRTHIDTIQNKASLGLLQHIAFSVLLYIQKSLLTGLSGCVWRGINRRIQVLQNIS